MASLGALGAGKAFAILGPGDASLLSARRICWILCAYSRCGERRVRQRACATCCMNEFPGALRPGPRVLKSLFPAAWCWWRFGWQASTRLGRCWSDFILILGFRAGSS